MRVRLAQGDVQVKIAETGEWAPASVNMPLVEGDELWVPEESLAVIQTSNGANIRLSQDTALQVLRVDRDSYQFYLAQGYAYVMSLAPRRSVYQFDTPDGSIRAFGNATFRIDIPDGETDVSVFKGSVLAENISGTTRVQAGTMLAFADDGFAELSPIPPPDDWQRWNERRDRAVLARGESQRYLPDELRVYSGDLDENGRWVNVEGFGYCWTPTVLVIGDWAPYRHGRWAWRGGDYVWIGYEPWGWAPYHYGRWTFVARIGWCWVPPSRGDVYWGPGYVGWVRTGDHVAWVPLAPRETYYGYGSFGRNSVNITNVNINQVRITNVYRNVNVTNSITVVNQNTFITGRPAPVQQNVVVNLRENFKQRRNIVVGRPPIQPTEASYHPVVRSIPEEKRPPTTVRRIDVKELKQSRPLVKESERSTLRPQAQSRPLEVRKVEKPKSLGERIRERQQVRPPEGDRGKRPGEAPPEESVRPSPRPGAPERGIERRRPPQAPPEEKAQPQRPQRAPERGVEKGRELRQAPPEEKAQPSPAQRAPERGIEKGRELRQAPPEEKAQPSTPQRAPERGVERRRPPQAPPEEKAQPSTPQRAPERGVERRRPPQAPPEEKAQPSTPPRAPERGVERRRPPQAPAESVRPERPKDEQGRGKKRAEEPAGKRQRVAPKDKEAGGQQDNTSKGRDEKGKR
jgi:hypothetical protein